MCGIAGVLSFGARPPDLALDEQLKLLVHRGPDSTGLHSEGRGAIGQTRLAVIDLETGDPPILNEGGTIVAALNGEIYNFRTLRSELVRTGHRFRSSGDTEVLVHLAEERAPVEIARLVDGMFAFALWDAERERLVLARDRVGKKPLYFCQTSEALVFGSEIKSVLAHPSVPRELEPLALSAYLTFGYVPTPRTFFAGVSSLPPGHILIASADGQVAIEPFWSLPSPPPRPTPRTLAQAAVETREHLTRAVERRLISDVPLGAFLSGGLDSATVVALMASLSDRPVKTFTIGFDDRYGFDERPYAGLVARRFATEHQEFVVQPDAVDLVERLVWHHDQPFGDSSAVPTFLLSQVTRDHVTVALAGDGGDELFAGYERFWAALALGRYQALPRPLRTGLRAGVGRLPATALHGRVGSMQRFTRQGNARVLDAYRSWLSFFDEPQRSELLPGASAWALEDYERRWSEGGNGGLLDRLLHLNLTTYLPDDLLVKVDRTSMAHGLEVRSPFLDAELVAFAFQLAPELKLRRLTLKRVLKEAMRELLPAEIVGRRKKGFGVPLDRWFREDLRGYVGARLGARDARVKAHLSAPIVDRLLAEHLAGGKDHGQALWLLLTLEVFLRNQGW